MHQRWLSQVSPVLNVVMVTVAVGVVGCSQNQTDATANAPAEAVATQPQVVATTSVLCDLTQQVAQDTLSLTCLMEAGQDPHTYHAKPSDRQAIDSADLVLYDGYNYAPAIIGLVESSSSTAPKIAVYEAAVPNPLMGTEHSHDHAEEADHGHAEEADHDHAEDDPAEGVGAAAAVPDPHIWHNPLNNRAIVEVIAAQLAAVNPEQADLYQQNAAQLADQFDALNRWIEVQVATIPENQRKLVTTHDAFRYFAEAYGFEVAGALSGLSNAEKPSVNSLTALVDQVKAAQVPAIFAETSSDADLIGNIARDAGVKLADQPLLVEGPDGAGSTAATTQAMLVSNTCAVVDGLGGTCDEAAAPL